MTARPLRLGGVPEHFNLPWHLAIESDALPRLDVTWEDQPGGTGEMLAKLGQGDLDVVSILTEGTVSAVAAGLDVTIIQVYVSSPLQWGVFVPGASAFRHEGELEGARIAISRRTSGSHLMAFIHADRNGWPIADEQFVTVGGLDGAIASFAARESDLFLWDRYMTSPLVESGDFRQLGVQETPWPSFVIAARNEVLTGRTTEVGRVVDAVVAEAVALHGRPGITATIAERYGLAEPAVEAWLATTSFAERGPMDPSIGPSVLETLARAGFG